MAFSSAFNYIPSLLLLTASTAIAENGPRILDLSKPFPVGNIYNEDQVHLESFLTRDIRRFLVLEDGEIVWDYQRNTVEDEDIFNLWSATKGVMSMIFGTIIPSDDYDITLDTTLGEIFTGENDWREVIDPEELEFKKNATMYELLTMTSGMTSPLTDVVFGAINPLNQFASADIANAVGINLARSLAFHGWNETLKGEFEYIVASNVLSYVIREVTGMTPFEYCSVDIFPSLGIDPNEIEWDKNFGGVETSLSNLKMTAKHMAKFAQLYLQKGKSSPEKQLVPESWVEQTLVDDYYFEDYNAGYGMFWLQWPVNRTAFANAPEDDIWCGAGFMGQFFCMNYSSKRVVAFQRSNTVWDMGNMANATYIMAAAFSSDATWEVGNVTAPPTSVSGGVSISVMDLGLVVVAISCLAVLL